MDEIADKVKIKKESDVVNDAEDEDNVVEAKEEEETKKASKSGGTVAKGGK